MSAFVYTQYEGGESKGCGIVEFQSSNDALRAISLLSNSVRCVLKSALHISLQYSFRCPFWEFIVRDLLPWRRP